MNAALHILSADLPAAGLAKRLHDVVEATDIEGRGLGAHSERCEADNHLVGAGHSGCDGDRLATRPQAKDGTIRAFDHLQIDRFVVIKPDLDASVDAMVCHMTMPLSYQDRGGFFHASNGDVDFVRTSKATALKGLFRRLGNEDVLKVRHLRFALFNVEGSYVVADIIRRRAGRKGRVKARQAVGVGFNVDAVFGGCHSCASADHKSQKQISHGIKDREGRVAVPVRISIGQQVTAIGYPGLNSSGQPPLGKKGVVPGADGGDMEKHPNHSHPARGPRENRKSVGHQFSGVAA